MSLWLGFSGISWCGYVSGGYISFIDVTVTAKINGDYSWVSIDVSVLMIVVVAVTVSVAVVVVSCFCGLVSVVGMRSSIASSVTVSGYVMVKISVSNLSTFRLGDLQKNWIVMITVIISSWKLWIKSVTVRGGI